MRSHWSRVGPDPMTGVLMKREIWMQTLREDGHVTTKAETGVMHL